MPLPATKHPYRTNPKQRVTRVTPSDDTWIPVVRMADDSWKDFYFMNLGFANDKPAGVNTANPATAGTESFGVPNPATSELSQPAGSHWRVSQNPQPVGADKHITLWKSGELELVDTTGTATALYPTAIAPWDPEFSGIGLRLAAQSSTSGAGVEIVPRTVYPPAESPSKVGSLTWRTPEVAGMIQGAGGGAPVADTNTSIIIGHYSYVDGLAYVGGGTYRDRCWVGLGVKNLGATWERAFASGIWAPTWTPASGQAVTFPAAPRTQPFNENGLSHSYEWMLEIPQESAYFPAGTPNVVMFVRGPDSAAWVPGNDGWSPFAGIHNNENVGVTCTSAVITNWQYRWMKYRGISP